MKKDTRLVLVLSGILCITIIVSSCRKDRIQVDDYQDMESFYNDHEEEEQELTVDSIQSGSCFVTAKKGTRICVTRDMLQDTSGNDIPDYPFQLKVIELYSIKDMILRRQPSVASGNILETSAEIRVRPHKNGNEAFLKSGRKYFMETAVLPVVLNNMEAYYGFGAVPSANWTGNLAAIIPGFNDTLSSVTPMISFYAVTPAKTDYVSAARLHLSSASYFPVAFTVPGTNTQNIQIYFSFNNFKSVMKVTNLVSFPLPAGESVKMIAFGKIQTNEFVMHQQVFVAAPGLVIPLNMQVVSESALLTALDGL